MRLANDKGEEREENQCGLFVIFSELMQIRERLLGVQQATESMRNVEDRVGHHVADSIRRGFTKLAKAQLLRDNPALAIIGEE